MENRTQTRFPLRLRRCTPAPAQRPHNTVMMNATPMMSRSPTLSNAGRWRQSRHLRSTLSRVKYLRGMAQRSVVGSGAEEY